MADFKAFRSRFVKTPAILPVIGLAVIFLVNVLIVALESL